MAAKAKCKKKVWLGFCRHGCPADHGLCHTVMKGRRCRDDFCKYFHPDGKVEVRGTRSGFNMPGCSGAPDEVAPKPKKRPREAVIGSQWTAQESGFRDEDEEERKAQRRCERFGIENPPQLPEEPEMTVEAAKALLNIRFASDCTIETLGILKRAALADLLPDDVAPEDMDHRGILQQSAVKLRKIWVAYRVLIPHCRRPGQAPDEDQD
jgi:hypothetical protein